MMGIDIVYKWIKKSERLGVKASIGSKRNRELSTIEKALTLNT